MKKMNPKLVATIRKAMKGNRLAKFDASIKVLNDSLAQGQWIPRGSVKAESGFYQGLVKAHIYPDPQRTHSYGTKEYKDWDAAHGVMMLLNYGNWFRVMGGPNHAFRLGTDEQFKTGVKLLREYLKLPPDTVLNAWRALVNQKNEAKELLDNARPKPVITKIGLSPKVTKTLTEMNLDIHLPSIRMADIVPKKIQAFDESTKKPMVDEDGKPVMITIWVVKWTKGIKLNMTRFSMGSGCDACGRPIPSGSFVPVEAKDKKSGKLVGMWIGCDCAANIFGIKDVGIKKPKEAK